MRRDPISTNDYPAAHKVYEDVRPPSAKPVNSGSFGSGTGSVSTVGSSINSTGESKNILISQITEIVFEKEFANIQRIDSGSYGTVFRADWRNRVVAVKKLDNVSISSLGARTVRQVKQELDILDRLRSDRTIKLEAVFRDQNSVYLITKFYITGSMYDLLHETLVNQECLLPRELFFNLSLDICEGLNYLHNFDPQILHLDLKPKNILIDGRNDRYSAVIADFGLSTMKSESKSNIALQARGTAPYMAPDFFSGKVSEKADIFSFGIILWEMFFCEEPYRTSRIPTDQLINCVQSGVRPSWEIDTGRIIPQELKDLIQKCWSKNPNERPFAHELYRILENFNNTLEFINKDN